VSGGDAAADGAVYAAGYVTRLLRFSWLLAVVPVWLGARAVAYALAPANPVARELEGRTGGTAPVAVTAVAVVAALAVAAGVLFVASLAVRERATLAGEEAPRIRWRRVVMRAVVLFALAAVVFTGAETLLHLQAGLGFHGWHCLLGPMHRDALPFLGGFAAAASLVVAATERIVAWARRIVRALRSRTPRLRPAPLPRPASARATAFLPPLRLAARGPPLAV
jgi:hypothetical protein